MSDSFFTTRTSADLQFDDINVITCQTYLDACVRRIAKLEGPLGAAKRTQRLADICAGAYVLPIEHWQKIEPSKAPVAPAATTMRKRFFDFIGGPTGNYLIGFVTGYLIGRS
jgi:hypothetical protein